MAISKEDKALEPDSIKESALVPKDAVNKFGDLPSDNIGGINAHLSSVTDIINLIYSSITTHNLFKPHLEPLKARACIAQGNLDTLKLITKRNPAALFQKGGITDPRGRTFYNVSAWQLILFLCDVDMKNELMPLIPEQFKAIAEQQTKALGSGGADLIKLSRDPQAVAFEDFKGITQFKQTFTLFDRTRQEVTFPLLENVDGIVYFQDADKEVHFYYANRDTKMITPLEPNIKSEEDKQLFAEFKASFEAMENNSSRRSSDTEHQLIAKLFNAKLQRQGIQYEHHSIRYQNSRSSFSLINALRKNIRLSNAAEQNGKWGEADTHWREGVGKAQGEEMWLLERICEEGRPFHPLPADFKEFKRGVLFYNWIPQKVESVFTVGKLAGGLGLDFALYKGCGRAAAPGSAAGVATAGGGGVGELDLIAVCRLVEDAKANINEPLQEPVTGLLPSNSH